MEYYIEFNTKKISLRAHLKMTSGSTIEEHTINTSPCVVLDEEERFAKSISLYLALPTHFLHIKSI